MGMLAPAADGRFDSMVPKTSMGDFFMRLVHWAASPWRGEASLGLCKVQRREQHHEAIPTAN